MEKFGRKFKIYKNGFTLAEVLITLVIVGVVAALTIPTAINNYRKQEYVSGLKKAYGLLSNATNAIMYEEGSPRCDIGGWACNSTRIANLYKKHLSVMKDCGASKDYACFEQGRPKYLSGSLVQENWGQFGGTPYKMILSNGMQIVLGDGVSSCTYDEWGGTGIKNFCKLIIVDINGSKGPNTYGRDLYYFAIKENGLFPAGSDVDGRCETTYHGWGCANKVLRENAMNY